MDLFVTNRPMLTQAITAYQKFEDNMIPFAVAVLNIFLPSTSKKEVNKIVEDNFRSEKDRVLEKDYKYYILMNGSTIEVAEKAVNRLKANLALVNRNFQCLKSTKRIQASAFILGTKRITKRLECKYVDLTPGLNFFNKETHIVQSGFKQYLKHSVIRKTNNHSDDLIVNILA